MRKYNVTMTTSSNNENTEFFTSTGELTIKDDKYIIKLEHGRLTANKQQFITFAKHNNMKLEVIK